MTSTYGLIGEHTALIEDLHKKVSAQANLLNQSSVSGQRVGPLNLWIITLLMFLLF
ncbi:MAG: hypothetical protein LRY76_02025 [Alphaproteobacteria bacterium]|nr:hypothetical protein [Alphaproteobacteria bacterium]